MRCSTDRIIPGKFHFSRHAGWVVLLILVSLNFLVACQGGEKPASRRLLHVSYDPTREFFEAYNRLFVEKWSRQYGEEISVVQSHAGSGKQARAVSEGLPADVVSLALAFDIDQISRSGAIAKDWQRRLPSGSSPFYSTIVFLVRKDNPKMIADWEDLIRPGLEIITPNPKTSGGARWNYLAAWSYGMWRWENSEQQVLEFMQKLLLQVPVFDSGARGAATTFVERELGDVLLTWESDAQLIISSDRGSGYMIIYPSRSVRAEPAVSVVDRTVDKRGTRVLAEAYLGNLYLAEAQMLLTDHHFRSIDAALMQQKKAQFPELVLAQIDQFGGWESFQKKHFADDGIFDRLQQAR